MGDDGFKKFKSGVSFHDIESFTRKHTTEVFSILAIFIATISSAFDFFTGPGTSLLFLAAGAIFAILFPIPGDRWLKQLYTFTYKQEKTTEIILGALKIVIAIFIPFLYFGLLGLLAGSSYHYYVREAQKSKASSKEENDHKH